MSANRRRSNGPSRRAHASPRAPQADRRPWWARPKRLVGQALRDGLTSRGPGRAPALSRRAFLGGAAAAVALPFLEATMLPRGLAGRAAAASRDASGPPTRLVYFYVPNGIHMPAWTPGTTGPGFTLPPILTSLAPVQSKVSVLTGFANYPAYPDGPGDHAAGTGAFLTCTHVKKTEGSDIQNGISCDQVAANAFGDATTFSSLELGLEGGGSTGGCDSGYSCAYARNIAWAGPQTPLPKTVNPQLVFDRLFGGYDDQLSAEEQARRRTHRTSVLDLVAGEAKALKGVLGVSDQLKLDEYLTGVRELEERIEAEGQDLSCSPPTEPVGPWSVEERAALMMELTALALACDQTRVVTFMLGNAGSNRSYDFLGVSGAHHPISHHQNVPANFASLTTIATWEVGVFSDLLQRLEGSPEQGGSSLLDHSLVFFSSEIEDGNAHRHVNLPVLLAGGAGAGVTVTAGQHVEVPEDLPIANLFLGMMQTAGVPATGFGDATGAYPLS